MRISPLDIRKQTFKKSMRGVDTEEVRIFLELVASEYEKVLQENAMMAERMRHQDERLEEYRDLEKSMRNSLVTAERIASESRAASEREAQRIVQDANIRAERILEGARERLQGLIREIEGLRGKREAFLRRFVTLIQSQIGVVDDHATDMDEVDSLRREVENLLTSRRSQVHKPGPADEAEDAPVSPEEFRSEAPRPVRPVSRFDRDATGEEERRPVRPPARLEPESLPEDEAEPASRPAYGRLEPVMEPEQEPAPRSELESEPEFGREIDSEPDSEDREEPEAGPRALPRGLGRLLRGRQGSLPLESASGQHEEEETPEGEEDEEGPQAFFPTRQRREGFFEISASDEEERSRTRRG